MKALKTHAAAVFALLAIALQPTARAGDATVTCTTPTNTGASTAKIKITNIDGSVVTCSALITPGMTAKQKAHALAQAVDNNAVPNYDVDESTTDPSFTVKNLAKGTKVEFDPGKTGEVPDKIEVGKLLIGDLGFQGHFDPFNYHGQPAVFSAGIVTDLGVLNTTISAQELNFQTDGPIICQALFQRLAPRAPQYGAQINYAGDRLEVYFDPAYTVTQGGIIFGTNSRSEGAYGGVIIPTDPVGGGCNGCDVNCDGSVNQFDIPTFVSLLSGTAQPCSPCAGDANQDGSLNGFDIEAFIGCLSN